MVLDNPHIDYSLIADAEAFYKEAGFQRIEAPWAVPYRSIEITAPEGSTLYPHDTRAPVSFLVASGEQSLLEWVSNCNWLASCNAYDEKASRGRFLTITPCFREEKTYSKFTRPYFLKVELFDNKTPLVTSLKEIRDLCFKWFTKHIECSVVVTDQSESDPIAMGPTYDIVTKSGIELGSYGIRSHPSVGKWIYATGCAEPRLSASIAHESSDK